MTAVVMSPPRPDRVWPVWVAVALVLFVALASQLWKPRAQPDPTFKVEALVPEAFGTWRLDPSVIPVKPSLDEQAKLDQIYDQILSRTYVNAQGEQIMLVIAYGGDQSDSLKAHRQEVCYEAQGFEVREVLDETAVVAGRSLPLVRMFATNDGRLEPVSYWFTMGDRIAISRTDRMAAQVYYGLQGRIPDGMLVRVSSAGADPRAGYRLHERFLGDWFSVLDEATRVRLAGARSGS